ncbi:Synergin gamma [Acipenser ruthenus]|uniref:Synergin gamma n=1 Tax=Acipenser ruthenus TaxID=7906 RepID=A0A444V0R3_ACIRT|nr:Synergin gamma [Acipenser ruthenus]
MLSVEAPSLVQFILMTGSCNHLISRVSPFIAFAEVDDFKFDPFGTFSAGDSAVSSLASFDWSEREEPATNQSKKPQPSFFTSDGSPASATSVLQKKETSFGSAENVAVTTSGKVINKANDTLNGISSSSVCTEVIQSAQGMEYLLGVVEVYRVVRRVELGIKATAVCSDKLQQLLKDINRVWHNLIGFMSLANLSPDESSLDFSSCILRHGIKNAKELACGVCLLSVDSRSKVDDFKFDPFGTFSAGDSAVSSLASFDWSEREEPATNQSKKPQPSFFTSDGSPASATSVLQKKETSFGSAENVAVTTSGKVSAFTSEEASSASTAEGQFDTFADFGTKGQVSEKSDTAPVSGDPGSDTTQPDDFGASQADKPKFGKFDFLMASSQAKVKSSEEMIRSELATFDLSVQGSHKRSLSLGDKEISHSTPSPAPEQPFRDKSNTLSEKPALPVIRDKYKDLTGEVEVSNRLPFNTF